MWGRYDLNGQTIAKIELVELGINMTWMNNQTDVEYDLIGQAEILKIIWYGHPYESVESPTTIQITLNRQ
jgi:hypothetical protein